MSLERYRQTLFTTTQAMLKLKDERKALVTEIQKLKKLKNTTAWAPKQEVRLFTKLSPDLKNSDLLNLFWLSLTIEMQSCVDGTYPCWSKRAHLLEKSFEISEQINPILLKMFYPQDYAKLQLSDFYKNQIQENF